MKIIPLPLTIFLFLSFSIFGFVQLVQARSLGNESELQQAYTHWVKQSSNKELQLKFFNAFPNSFAQFKSIFGYEDDANGRIISKGVLYSNAPDYVSAFFQLNKVDPFQFNYKCIQIAQEGKWQADGVNIFLTQLRKRVLAHPEAFAPLLEKLNNREQQSFWYALFDGPHPPKSIYPELVSLQSSHPISYANMVLALQQVHYNANLSHNDALVQQIQMACLSIDKRLASFEKVEKDSLELSGEGAHFTGYFDNKQVQKIQAEYMGHTGNLKEEIYYQQEKLIFRRTTLTHYKPGSFPDSVVIDHKRILDIYFKDETYIHVILNGKPCTAPFSEEINKEVSKGLGNSKSYLEIFGK